MESSEHCQVMARHIVQYQEHDVLVEFLQLTHSLPEFYFFVHLREHEILLRRFNYEGNFWCGSGLTLAESHHLGEAIESQIGYLLPGRPSDNPFTYTGERATTIQSFIVGDLHIRRARAIYTKDVYYEVTLSPARTVTMVKLATRLFDHGWSCELPNDLTDEDRQLLGNPLELGSSVGQFKQDGLKLIAQGLESSVNVHEIKIRKVL